MKYSDKNPPLECTLFNSTCYKGSRTFTPKGILWHSTGANNKTLKRYIQPCSKNKNADELLKLIGYNQWKNDWGSIYREAGVNAFIGTLADGTVTTCQTLPWTMRPWGCASSKHGSFNNTHIQVECCEDALTDRNYFNEVYTEACELSAYLCTKYGWDPHGTFTYNGYKVPRITCHWEAYELGFGSSHSDVKHWWPKFGKYMTEMRDDIATIMAGGRISTMPAQTTPTTPPPATPTAPTTPKKEEDEDMTLDTFSKLMNEYRKGLQDNDASDWSKSARDWAVSSGLIQGSGTTINGQPNYMWSDMVNREQLAQLLYRFAQMMGKA